VIISFLVFIHRFIGSVDPCRGSSAVTEVSP
jgi:hypothetical protein